MGSPHDRLSGGELTSEFVHWPLGQDVEAIGGHYVMAKEVRLPFEGREVLYLVGYGSVNACCGLGGCAFAWVPGYLVEWKVGSREGQPVSKVEPIRDEVTRNTLRDLIQKQESVTQVNFL